MALSKFDVRVGSQVIFQGCRGVVEKCNPKRAKVRALDAKGTAPAGMIWNVPYSMLEAPKNGGASEEEIKEIEAKADAIELIRICYQDYARAPDSRKRLDALIAAAKNCGKIHGI